MSVATLNVGEAGRHSVAPPALVFVPGGRFRMGSESGRPDEWPVHEAQVRPVRMGRAPVSNLEYAWFLASGRVPEPPWWKDPAFWDPQQPVVGVTWFEAMSFCVWLVARPSAAGGACRPRPSGSAPPVAASRGRPRPGGPSFPSGRSPSRRSAVRGRWGGGPPTASACWTWGRSSTSGASTGTPPRPTARPGASTRGGPSKGERRASRGGSWRHHVRWSPPAARSSLPPHSRYADYGFRVVREVP